MLRRSKMAEEENKPKVESEKKVKEEKKEEKKVEATKPEVKAEAKPEAKKEEKKEEKKPEEKAEEKESKEPAKEQPKIAPKDEAVARGVNLRASKKHFMYLSNMIKNKNVDDALSDMIQVTMMKKVVPFKGEIPHRKGKGMMSGRYPVKAAALYIPLLKALKGNIVVNGMDPDKARIAIASASWASRPMRSGNRSGKRTNLVLIAREPKKKKKAAGVHKETAGGSL